VKALRDYLEKRILETIPNVLVNGDRNHKLRIRSVSASNTWKENPSSSCFPTWDLCFFGFGLHLRSLEPSHVLRAMGVPFTAAHGSIRFSLSIYNTKEEMDYILEHLPRIVARLRDISPFWKDYLKSQGKT